MKAMLWIAAGAVGTVALAGAAWAWTAASVETPSYELAAQDGAFELRRYPALAVARIEKRGDRRAAVRAAFGPLAGYIFAREREGEKIAMTAPVTQSASENATRSGAWTVAFIMPEGRLLDDLPSPKGDVRLAELPARMMAAWRFSGRWTDENFAAAEAALTRAVEARGLSIVGPVEYAYYNDPFTPFFLRRNEVMAEVRDAPEES